MTETHVEGNEHQRVRTETVEFRNAHTWYRITEDERPSTEPVVPLIVLHGGPGCTHHYLLSLTDLTQPNRPVVHYDQLGNGLSTHLPSAPSEFWSVGLFIDELSNLLDHLGYERYDLLGQSWGGMLAAEYATLRPTGLRNLIIADAPASMPLWLSAAAKLRSQLDPETQQILRAHETAGTTDSDEYRAAAKKYYAKHVLRLDQAPAEKLQSDYWMREDPTVYHTMNGPNEFHVIGSLKDWSVIDRLHSVQARTLVINGYYDEATDETVAPYVTEIAGAQWHQFKDSSHSPHVEERAEYMRIVDAFLRGASV